MAKALSLDKPDKASSVDKVSAIKKWLDQNYEIRINVFDPSKSEIHSKRLKYEHPISPNDIWLHMYSDDVSCSDSTLRKILTSPNQIRTYNPIIEYFQSLVGKYAGSPQIDLLCEHLVARDFGDREEGYYQQRLCYYIKKWFVAAAAQVLRGHANDVAIGLIHTEEGIGKTYLAEFITPSPLKEYFIKSDKDEKKFNLSDAFAKNLIVLFDEFEGINNRTSDGFKKVLSFTEIPVKFPREPFPVVMPRLGSAIFTSNRNQELGGFLIPQLGYRRFGTIELESINQHYSREVNVEQLWAEAVMLLDQNFSYEWTRDDFDELKQYNQRYMVESKAVTIISTWYEKPATEDEGIWKMPSEILSDLRRARKLTGDLIQLTEVKIGMAMKQIGFRREGRKIKDVGTRYQYLVRPLFFILLYINLIIN